MVGILVDDRLHCENLLFASTPNTIDIAITTPAGVVFLDIQDICIILES